MLSEPTHQPGSYFCVSILWKHIQVWRWRVLVPDFVGWLIALFSLSLYTHAGIYEGFGEDGQEYVIEANPKYGIKRSLLSEYTGRRIVWSPDALTPGQQDLILATARELLGIPYGFLDFVAILLHIIGVRVPAVVNRILRNDRLICSQAVAVCGLSAKLVSWLCGEVNAQFVKPSELARRCTKALGRH